MEKKINVAYLAHEIPSLSCTFVYNEIFELEKNGLSILPFSLHEANYPRPDPTLEKLAQKTSYLYNQSKTDLIKKNGKLLLSQPLSYLKNLSICIFDAVKLLPSFKLSSGLIYRFLIAGSMVKKLIDNEISHIHIHFIDIPTDVGMYAAALANINFSVTAHANDIFTRLWLADEKINRSQFIATISNFNVDLFSSMGVNKNKIHVVRCGVDAEKFTPREPKEKTNTIVFGFLGRLVEKKGAHILIAACAELLQHHSNFTVQIVGSGPLLEDLKIQAQQLKLDKRIHFLGSKPHGEINQWLEQLDYFVMPCVEDQLGDMDGIPVALMEAMLKGIPVISTNISGIPELIINNETGLLAQSNNISQLETALRTAMQESPDATKTRLQHAQKLVKDEYDLISNTKKLLQLIINQPIQ